MFKRELKALEYFTKTYECMDISYIHKIVDNIDKTNNTVLVSKEDPVILGLSRVLNTGTGGIKNKIYRTKEAAARLMGNGILISFDGLMYLNPIIYTFKEFDNNDVLEASKDTEVYKACNGIKNFIPMEFWRPRMVKENPRGMVYLLTDASGFIKIGMTNNIAERVRSIKSMNPTVRLLGYIYCDDNTLVEAELHKKFKKDCYYNEWFNISEKRAAKALIKYREY